VLQSKTELLQTKSIPLPLCQPQMWNGTGPGPNPSLRGEKPATNCLSHRVAWIFSLFIKETGYAVAQLRHCATSQKVAGSFPDGITGIFHWHNPSSRTVALGLTQPLTEMSTRNISWGVKTASAWGRQPYHLHVPIVLKSGTLNILEPSGPVQACNGIALPLPSLKRQTGLYYLYHLSVDREIIPVSSESTKSLNTVCGHSA